MLSNLPPVTKPASGPAASESRLNQLESCAPQPPSAALRGSPCCPSFPVCLLPLDPGLWGGPGPASPVSPTPASAPSGTEWGLGWELTGEQPRGQAENLGSELRGGQVPASWGTSQRRACLRQDVAVIADMQFTARAAAAAPLGTEIKGWRSKGARDSWPERRGAFEETPL